MMMNVWFRFLMVGIGAAMAAEAPDDSKYLYHFDPNADAVQEFTGDEGDFLASTQPRVVEFYSPFCGACRVFKPHYLALAAETQDAYPNVEFYAVSCLAHKEMCKKFSINSFPSLFTFAGGSDSEAKKLSRTNANLEDVSKALELGDDSDAQPSRQLDEANNDSEEEDTRSEKEEDSRSQVVDEDGNTDSDEEDTRWEQNEGMSAEEDEDASAEEDEDASSKEDEDVSSKEDEDASASADGVASREMDEDEAAIQVMEEELAHVPDAFDSRDAKKGDDSNSEDNGEDEEIPIANHGKTDSASASDSKDTSDGPAVPLRQRYQGKAGALAARSTPLEMDRYKALMKMQHQKLKKKHGSRWSGNQESEAGPPTQGAATSKMNAYRPGTPEFVMRKKRMDKLLEKMDRRNNLREQDGSTSYKKPGARSPIKKAVTKPRFVEKLPIVKRVIRMSDEETLILDTTLSFIHGLQFGVFEANHPLPAKKRRALKDWLDLLSVSLPAEWALHDLIDDLLANINSISESDENLNAILRKYPTPRAVWSDSCNKGVSGGQFSCGVWKLLHTVTVGVAEYRGGLNLLDAEMIPANAHMFSPLEAADTIRDYIENFFLCSECRENFLEHYDKCRNNRRCERLTDDAVGASSADWKELSAWFWEVHNEVSVRILNERADKALKKMQRSSAGRTASGPGAATMADEIKVLWPSPTECLTCFTDEGSWNQDGIFLFLEKTYWPGSDLDPMAFRLMSLDNVGPEGSWLTIFLAIFGIGLVYFMRQSLRSTTLQETLMAARAMGPRGAVGSQKRSV